MRLVGPTSKVEEAAGDVSSHDERRERMMAFNEQVVRQRALDYYRAHLERTYTSQHRWYVGLLCLAATLVVVSANGVTGLTTARGSVALWPLLSILSQSTSLLMGINSHRAELRDLNVAEKSGAWPEGRDARLYRDGIICQGLNAASLVLCAIGALALLR